MSEQQQAPIGEQETVDLQANAFTDIFTKTVPNLLGRTVTANQRKATENAVAAFIGKDGLQLALDSVGYVQTRLPGTTGVAARDAAIAQLKADAAVARKDLSAITGSIFNFVIEGALQIAVAKALEAAAAAV